MDPVRLVSIVLGSLVGGGLGWERRGKVGKNHQDHQVKPGHLEVSPKIGCTPNPLKWHFPIIRISHQNSWVSGIIGSYETLASSALAGALNMARSFVLGNRQNRFERFEHGRLRSQNGESTDYNGLPRVTFSTVWILPSFHSAFAKFARLNWIWTKMPLNTIYQWNALKCSEWFADTEQNIRNFP